MDFKVVLVGEEVLVFGVELSGEGSLEGSDFGDHGGEFLVGGGLPGGVALEGDGDGGSDFLQLSDDDSEGFHVEATGKGD